MNGGESYGAIETQYIRRHHRHEPRENQCTSALVKHIQAPVHLVSRFLFLDLDFRCLILVDIDFEALTFAFFCKI